MSGSLINEMYGRMTKGAPTPEVGMGATVLHYTDRTAGTIIDVSWNGSQRFISVREDHAVRSDRNGVSDMQDYTFACNPNGRVWNFKQNREGRWREVYWNKETKRWRTGGTNRLLIGQRQHYYDFSF